MTQAFLYLHKGEDFLAARWLEEHGRHGGVCLVHDDDTGAVAATLAAAYPAVERTLPLRDVAQSNASATGDGNSACVTLPMTPDAFPLYYRHPVRVPDFRPHAGLLRDLWLAGFREVAPYHLGGTRRLSLPHHLCEFQDRHKGQRCFIIGNGPSLNALDMTRLRGEITLCANRGYLGFEAWGFDATYWGVYDPLQIERYGAEYERNVPAAIPKFFPLEYWPLLQVEHGCPLWLDWPRKRSREFSDEPDRLVRGYSVVYMLLQIAAVMGCDPIILVGMDHRYHLPPPKRLHRMVRLAGRWAARRFDHTTWYHCGRAAYHAYFQRCAVGMETTPSRLWNRDAAGGATHFDQRYAGERREFLMPRPQDMEADYRCARDWAAQQGRTICNATPDSALTVFPPVDFERLF